MCCLWPVSFSLNILDGDGVTSGAFRLGCVLTVILALRLWCCRKLLLLLPLVLDLDARVVVVCFLVSAAVTVTFPYFGLDLAFLTV